MATKAKESAQIAKARKKLKQQIVEEHKHINEHALQEMRKVIQHWIARHEQERVDLKDKTITLFDENKHTVQPKSKFISSLMKNLKQQTGAPMTAKKLSGRVVPT